MNAFQISTMLEYSLTTLRSSDVLLSTKFGHLVLKHSGNHNLPDISRHVNAQILMKHSHTRFRWSCLYHLSPRMIKEIYKDRFGIESIRNDTNRAVLSRGRQGHVCTELVVASLSHCYNCILILDLTPGSNGLVKDYCKTRQETLTFWDLVRLILEVWI